MECSVVGTRRIDMKDNSGGEVHGWSVYITREEDGVKGLLSEKLFISDAKLDRDLNGVVPSPGDTMNFEFNSRGKLGKILSLGG